MRVVTPRGRYLVLSIVFALVLTACADEDVDVDPVDEGAADPENGEEGEGLVLNGELVADQELLDAATEDGNLILYSSIAQEGSEVFAEAFEEDTGISTQLVNAPTGRLHERVISEIGADQFDGDVIIMPDIAIREEFVEMDIMDAHTVDVWDSIPDEMKHEDGLWYVVLSGASPMAYNTEVMSAEEAPTRWQDLTDEQYRGLYGTVPVTQGANGWMHAMFQRLEFGEDFWQELADNEPRFYGSVGAAGDEIARGEVAVGIGRPPVIGDRIEQGAPLEFIWPEDGVPFFNFHGWVVRDAENSDAARLFMNWALSERAQSLIALETGDFPVHVDASPPEVEGEPLPSPDELNVYLPDADDWIELRDEWISEWNEIYGQ